MRSDFAASLFAEMLETFRERNTFGEVGNFLAGKDEYFGYGDWWRVFRTVPSMRRYLLPALFWNLAAGSRAWTGYSERYVPGRRYNFAYRTFCSDFLVWESLARYASHAGMAIPDPLRNSLADYFGLARSNCYEVGYRGRALPMFSYYPRFDHLVDPGNQVHRLFFSRDDNVPDIDTTCLILGSWISLIEAMGLPASAYRHDAAETRDLVALMADHVYGEGEYGRGSLSYENGARPGDRGVLTWVFDRHNELDPTSNVNILNYLVQIGRIRPEAPGGEVAALTRRIFAFLAAHAEDGTLLDQRFQSYYPLGPSLYFWRRFRVNWRRLGGSVRDRLDPEGRMEVIDGRLRDAAADIYASPPRACNPFDFLTAAPYLYESGMFADRIRIWLGDGLAWAEHFRKNHYEIFHLRYPSKIICAPIHIPFACLLDLFTLVDKNSNES